MTGDAWLARVVARHGSGLHVRQLAEARVARKVRELTFNEAKQLLVRIGAEGSTSTQRDWVGGWSQALDGHLRSCLVRRIRGSA